MLQGTGYALLFCQVSAHTSALYSLATRAYKSWPHALLFAKT